MRGLYEPWIFPYFVAFDQPMTKALYHEIIVDIEDAGAMVMCSTKDMGGDNEGLKRSLDITVTKPWSPNPKDPKRKLFFLFDATHNYKNTRNNFVDHSIICQDGMKITPKNEFEDAQKFCRQNEISAGDFITDKHVYPKSSTRQNEDLAFELLSEKMAQIFREHFPLDPKKQRLADIIIKLHRGVRVLKSTTKNHKDPYKCALGNLK